MSARIIPIRANVKVPAKAFAQLGGHSDSARAFEPLAANRKPFIVPSNAPRWCRCLDMSEAGAREIILPGKTYTIAPASLERIGAWVAGVSCNGPGRPFAVRSREGARRAILPHWTQAAALMLEVAIEYEAAVREHGDVRVPGPRGGGRGPNAHRPRNPTDGIRLDPRRRREVVVVLQRERERVDQTASPLTAWEAQVADGILDVLHSRARGLSAWEVDAVERLMAKLVEGGQ